jgi:hypothetical protein
VNRDASLSVFSEIDTCASDRRVSADPDAFADSVGRPDELTLAETHLNRTSYSGLGLDRIGDRPKPEHCNAHSKKDERIPSACPMADEPGHEAGQESLARGIVTLRHFLEVGWWLVAVLTCKFLAATGRFQSAVHLLPEGLATVTPAQYHSP